jgi:hypothetical protein
MKRLVAAALMLAVIGFCGSAGAQEKKAAKDAKDAKANPTGTWKWTVNFGGNEMERVLKLKLEGDKLSGTLSGGPAGDAKIEDAKYKDGEVTFKIQREFNGQKFTIHYSAKVSGDTLKGKSEIDRGDGEKVSRDFEAKRAKEKSDK